MCCIKMQDQRFIGAGYIYVCQNDLHSISIYMTWWHAHTDVQTHTLRINHLFCSVLLNVTLPMIPL